MQSPSALPIFFFVPAKIHAHMVNTISTHRSIIFSVIMLIVVSIGLKYLHLADWVYYAVLVAATLVVLVLSPVEDRNKPLDEIEHKVYKRRTILIAAVELTLALLLKLLMLDDLFIATAYSFVVLCLMLIAGKAKNRFELSK